MKSKIKIKQEKKFITLSEKLAMILILILIMLFKMNIAFAIEKTHTTNLLEGKAIVRTTNREIKRTKKRKKEKKRIQKDHIHKSNKKNKVKEVKSFEKSK